MKSMNAVCWLTTVLLAMSAPLAAKDCMYDQNDTGTNKHECRQLDPKHLGNTYCLRPGIDDVKIMGVTNANVWKTNEAIHLDKSGSSSTQCGLKDAFANGDVLTLTKSNAGYSVTLTDSNGRYVLKGVEFLRTEAWLTATVGDNAYYIYLRNQEGFGKPVKYVRLEALDMTDNSCVAELPVMGVNVKPIANAPCVHAGAQSDVGGGGEGK